MAAGPYNAEYSVEIVVIFVCLLTFGEKECFYLFSI